MKGKRTPVEELMVFETKIIAANSSEAWVVANEWSQHLQNFILADHWKTDVKPVVNGSIYKIQIQAY